MFLLGKSLWRAVRNQNSSRCSGNSRRCRHIGTQAYTPTPTPAPISHHSTHTHTRTPSTVYVFHIPYLPPLQRHKNAEINPSFTALRGEETPLEPNFVRWRRRACLRQQVLLHLLHQLFLGDLQQPCMQHGCFRCNNDGPTFSAIATPPNPAPEIVQRC